jgi:hypothetical protein
VAGNRAGGVSARLNSPSAELPRLFLVGPVICVAGGIGAVHLAVRVICGIDRSFVIQVLVNLLLQLVQQIETLVARDGSAGPDGKRSALLGRYSAPTLRQQPRAPAMSAAYKSETTGPCGARPPWRQENGQHKA